MASAASRFPLLEGESIGVVASGFAVRRPAVRAGIERLTALGFRVITGSRLFARDGYFAGSDRERAADLNRMFRHRTLRCIWFARGGYGTARLLPLLDWDALAERPKLLIGYSDVTALFARVVGDGLAPCVYGPMVGELADDAAFDASSLAGALCGEPVEIKFSPSRVLRHGRAAGPLMGGNLSVLAHLLGTPYAPRLAGAILLLEDAGEEVYRLDRLLTHLALAGAFDGLAAVALGRFVVPETRRSYPPDRPFKTVLRELFAARGIPVVTDLPFGHIPRKYSLPLGALAELDTRRGRLLVSGNYSTGRR